MSAHRTDRFDKRKPRPDTTRQETGSTLVWILILVVMMAATSAAFLSLGHSHQVRTETNEGSVRALELAEMGVAHATYELSRDEDEDGDGVVGDFAGEALAGTYEVTSTFVDKRHYAVAARGDTRDAHRRIEVVMWARPTTVFAQALAGDENVIVAGGFVTDSYDSDDGSYLSQRVNSDEDGSFAKPFGHVSSNGRISVSGSSTIVRGDVGSGPSTDPVIEGGPTISGESGPMEEPMELPPPPYEEFWSAYMSNNNAGIPIGRGITYDASNYTLAVEGGATMNLPPGIYFFTKLRVAGNAELVISGETKIYLTGNLEASGGTITNVTEGARNLSIIAYPYEIPEGYDPPNPQEIRLAGGSSTALTVYAPAADVYISGGGDLFGAVVGRTIDARGAAFHYDEALGYEEDIDFQPYVRVGWRELGRPAD